MYFNSISNVPRWPFPSVGASSDFGMRPRCFLLADKSSEDAKRDDERSCQDLSVWDPFTVVGSVYF